MDNQTVDNQPTPRRTWYIITLDEQGRNMFVERADLTDEERDYWNKRAAEIVQSSKQRRERSDE